MDYPYENLDPEKFQEFSQALLIKEYPNMQCFPVAQPDGGRDAVAHYLRMDRTRDFMMFQVKYVRQPQTIEDPHKWLLDVMVKELPKIKNQILQGAKHYVLITNIRGTAHPETGTIDIINKLMHDELDIPAVCWWRDDINRRMDTAWDVKWVYPELMTGPDLIRAIIESGPMEKRERREAAIRAFITEQYSIDREVKFKQVELQNSLLDLYIDVPITSPQGASQKKHRNYYHAIHYNVSKDIQKHNIQKHSTDAIEFDFNVNSEIVLESSFLPERYRDEEKLSVGAASLLLHPLLQSKVPKIVLEGAPGQGKSTITQYVCQIHRMRLLDKVDELKIIPVHHRAAPIRLPFKVDLRDLANWLAKKNPFSSDKSDELPMHWLKSLESFLAAQVRHLSGGVEFDVADLIAIARVSSVLLVFDGLDEIADIARRRDVVDEIVKGVRRIEENATSLQVIVTSRPAAFANSPGLPEDEFPYYQLDSVTRQLIDEYSDKWLKARRLYGREAAEVKNILREKLNYPHLRDLARNPMQLAILLSLIHTRGASLPDKRTSLYDNYVELFFNREAEKSAIVREHRELLINIHRYLAWILHSEAELGNNSGSISEERLHKLLEEYLANEGHDSTLSKLLFTGMVERVVALVSRVQGTYEFEVQPLREYFAARFLYETAPYSPPGTEKHGTKPDRFDALARNFYWLNVTRFYAGCYSKGELASLIDRLQELAKEDGYRLISHPRILAATLLSDWVFTQHPKSVREVVALILDGIGLRYVLTSNSRRSSARDFPLVLPKNCGNDELIGYCFNILKDNPPRDYALDVIDLIKANATSSELAKIYLQYALSEKLTNRTRWLEYGINLGQLATVPITQLDELLSDAANDVQRLAILASAKRYDYLEKNEVRFDQTINATLNRDIHADRTNRIQYDTELFIHALDASRYAIAFRLEDALPLSDVLARRGYGSSAPLSRENISNSLSYANMAKCEAIIELAIAESKESLHKWATELAPWNNLVEGSRAHFGDRWVLYHIANVSSGIKSKTETCTDFAELFDKSKSLCFRTRYARLRAGTGSWWINQMESANDVLEKMSFLIVILTWGSTGTLTKLAGEIDSLIKKLSEDNWKSLFDATRDACWLTANQSKDRSVKIEMNLLPQKLDPKTVVLLGLRADQTTKSNLYVKYLEGGVRAERDINEFCLQVIYDSLNTASPDWVNALKVIRQGYLKGVRSERYAYHRFRRNHATDQMPDAVAKEIAKNAAQYPGFLVAAAEMKCRNNVSTKIIRVGDIAVRDKWFVL